jgi:hypothetical protein
MLLGLLGDSAANDLLEALSLGFNAIGTRQEEGYDILADTVGGGRLRRIF